MKIFIDGLNDLKFAELKEERIFVVGSHSGVQVLHILNSETDM